MGIHRSILRLSLPSIVSNITTPLLALVDVAIVGHMGAAEYIGAIAVGGSMFNMLYWLFAFLRMGSSGATAQAYGAGDRNEQGIILLQGFTVALISAALMILFQGPIARGIMLFMDPEPLTGQLALTYFDILIWGAPAVLANYVIAGWLLGMQNSSAIMINSIFINIVNIIVSCVLVYGFKFGIEGVAIGTLSAQWGGTFLGLTVIKIKYNPLKNCSGKIFKGGELKKFFSVNINIFLRTLCLVAVTLWFTRAGARQNSEILAVNALLMQFFTLFSYFMDGFAFAGEALAGRFLGERNYEMLKKSIRGLIHWGILIATLFTVLYAIGGEMLMSLLSDDTSVTATAADYKIWVITIPLAGFMAFTWDGIFIGALATRHMLLSMFSATVVFFVVYLILFPRMGNHGLWLAFLSYLAVRGIILTFFRHKITRS